MAFPVRQEDKKNNLIKRPGGFHALKDGNVKENLGLFMGIAGLGARIARDWTDAVSIQDTGRSLEIV